MLILIAIVVIGSFAVLAFHYWNQLHGPESSLEPVPFSRWVWMGLIIPSLGWLILNTGLLRALPPLMPAIAMAQSAGRSWMPLFFGLTVPGLLVIGTFWAAVTFGRLVGTIVMHAESRREFAVIAGVLGLVTAPLAWLCCAGGGMGWTGVGLLLWLVPATHCTIALAHRPKSVPMYARAVARMKFGKYREAEQEVIQQLEKREEDFEGWMMLAELYANQFGDLAEADRTVRALCDEPSLSAVQISMALHRLADWHLKLADNPLAARRALDEISRRLPGSHVARMAQLRANQLPRSRQEWLEQKEPKKITLPALSGELEDPGERAKLSRSDALTLVHECIDRLKRNPDDVPPREKLARLFTEQLGKVDLGIEQLELLVGMATPTEAKKAEWLSLMAAWHFRYRHDPAATERILHQLIAQFPQSAQAFAAQRWLNLLEMEQRVGGR